MNQHGELSRALELFDSELPKKTFLFKLCDKPHIDEIIGFGCLDCGVLIAKLREDRLHSFAADIGWVIQILPELVVGILLDIHFFHLKMGLDHSYGRRFVSLEDIHAFGIGTNHAPDGILIRGYIRPARTDRY